MSLMPSLCAALQRASGQRLVMRAGDRPHVLAGERRHDVATAVLSVNAVEALVDQILSTDSRRILSELGSVEEVLNTAAFPQPLTARAERVGDAFCVELIVKVEEPAPQPEPVPAAPAATEMADVEVEVADTIDEPTPSPVTTPAIDAVSPAVEQMPVAAIVAESSAPELIAPPIAPAVIQHVAPPASIDTQSVPPPIPHPPVRVVTRIEPSQPVLHSTTPARMDLHVLDVALLDAHVDPQVDGCSSVVLDLLSANLANGLLEELHGRARRTACEATRIVCN